MLKKIFTLFAVAALFVAPVSAQDIPSDEDDILGEEVVTEVLKPYTLSLGAKVGGNYSMAGDPDGADLGIGGNIGYSAGLAANVRFGRPAGKPFGTERFGVQVEALYSKHSLKSDAENIEMSCFEIPVLFQYYFLPNFAIEVGPTFTGALSTSPDELKFGNAIYQTKDIKAYDVKLSIGLNCKLRNGFTADIRYNMGNSDIAGNFETKVSTISLGIGWLFSVIK